MTNDTRKNEELIYEYPAVDRFRVRVLRKDDKTTSLDIREYVAAEKFQGFTRKGIRLTSKEHMLQLRDSISDALTRGWFD